jgi:hypothetical protein
MLEDSRKLSELQLSTITNVNSSTSSGDRDVEIDSNQPTDTETSQSTFQDVEVEPNHIEGDEPDKRNPIKSPQTPAIPQFWWLWKRKQKKPTRQ